MHSPWSSSPPPATECPSASPILAGVIALALFAVVFAAFSGVLYNGFILYDDPAYITENPWVREGFTGEGIRQAFTAARSDNWHPLTWLSHMLDVELFGLDPRGHHLVGLLLHAATASLLFLFLTSATSSPKPALAASLLFALHPLRVESVAWAAERKDLLCGLFWMLALIAYARWTRRGGAGRYTLVAFLMACALMSKGTAVVLPAALLVLDLWPLRRLERGWRSLVVEKIPLALLGVAGGVITWWAQRGSGALKGFDELPLLPRVANALASILSYLSLTLWPADLAVFYPHPGPGIAWGKPLLGALVAAALTVAAVRLARARPYLLAGWLLFLIPLLPVIGIAQVGWQAMADRYTYLPHAGLFIVPAFWAASLGGGRRRTAFAGLLAVALLLALLTGQQVGRWRSSVTLFTHALEVTRRNWAMEYSLGLALAKEGDDAGAIVHYRKALSLVPRFPEASEALAVSLRRQAEGAESPEGRYGVGERDAIPYTTGRGPDPL